MRQVNFCFSLCFLLLTSSSLFSQSLTWTTFDTGSNMSILLNLNSNPNVLGTNLAVGDQIGVFYTDDLGDLKCGGFIAWNGDTSQAISFAAYADDSNTTPKDGFDDGDSLIWRVRTIADTIDYEATATYDTLTPFITDFSEDGFAQVTELTIAATEILGCTDPAYLEYDPAANVDDGSCATLIIEGCTNSNYMEYNPSANVDNGSCLTLIVEGCTDPNYLEYNPAANVDDGSCLTLIVYGCTDTNYLEFNPAANVDDGSCETLIVYGCMDDAAQNYNPAANVDDGSCDYSCGPNLVQVTLMYTTTDNVDYFNFILSQNDTIVEYNNGNAMLANESYTHHYCVPNGALVEFEAENMENIQIFNCEQEISVQNSTAQFIAGCNVGINEIDATEIQVYPNPTHSTIQVEWNGNNTQLKLYDSVGRIVISKIVSNSQKSQLDLSNLDNGIYYLELSGGNNSYTEQIIKQ